MKTVFKVVAALLVLGVAFAVAITRDGERVTPTGSSKQFGGQFNSWSSELSKLFL